MIRKLIQIPLVVISILITTATSAASPIYNEEVLQNVKEFESKIGHEVFLPSDVPLKNPVVSSKYEDNWNRLFLNYSSNDSKYFIDVYIEADESNKSGKSYSTLKLEKEVQGYFKNIKKESFSIMRFNYDKSHYAVLLFSRDIPNDDAKVLLSKVSNSIITSRP